LRLFGKFGILLSLIVVVFGEEVSPYFCNTNS
jgi:hypothetical protein